MVTHIYSINTFLIGIFCYRIHILSVAQPTGALLLLQHILSVEQPTGVLLLLQHILSVAQPTGALLLLQHILSVAQLHFFTYIRDQRYSLGLILLLD